MNRELIRAVKPPFTKIGALLAKLEIARLETFFALPPQERKFVPRDPRRTQALLDAIGQEIPDTTLLVHFFGQNGKNVLKYDDFHRFMENLQSEVIEMEFLEFSRGLNTISEVEFARILLRYATPKILMKSLL
ncbi:mitochondrial calcium uptake family, member 3b [Elysia marginata]|uniref:Mitochondrial calcium uptake family, member 3b n=1 Tax=Elysia marginata TaxID=1093978 RepID=A0AAV4EVP5_9GAST|nr:mitochondrial calcium uptake family, member 3b [Elysia marginata]